MIDDEAAAPLASIPLYDDSFTRRRLYTAWDNLGDEERFFRGVDTLETASWSTSGWLRSQGDLGARALSFPPHDRAQDQALSYDLWRA
jgi:hypothetical protein